MNTDNNAIDFNMHLDICMQCADHPFALCPTGDVLLAKEVREMCNFSFTKAERALGLALKGE